MAVPEPPGTPGRVRPNILFIMADQLRRDALGVYGSWAETPHCDRIAAGAMVFDRAVTNSPVCKPARFSLALGQYPHNHGLWSNGPMKVPEGTPTWMSELQRAGYSTSVFGKLHLRGARDLRKQEAAIASLGFDVVNETVGPRGCLRSASHLVAAWEDAGVADAFRRDLAQRLANDPFVVRPSPLPLDLYYDTWVPARACEHIEQLPCHAPWFCMVSFGGPHEPWDAPEPYHSRFDPADAPDPLPRTRRSADARPTSLDGRPRPAHRLGPDRIRAIRANYAGSVALIDDQIGRLVAAVKQRGEWDETVVIITSDHGEMNGDHGLFYKNTFLDASVSVPLIVRIPGADPGRCHAPVELLDVGATALEVAGVEPTPNASRSLVGLCGDPTGPARTTALSEFLRECMVVDDRYKLIVDAEGESVMLFDHLEDPTESIDHLTEPGTSDIVAGLRDELLRTLIGTQIDASDVPKPGGTRRQTAAAGEILASTDGEPIDG